MILPVVSNALAAPLAEPLRQTWWTEKPSAPLPVNSVVGASQSRWPALGCGRSRTTCRCRSWPESAWPAAWPRRALRWTEQAHGDA